MAGKDKKVRDGTGLRRRATDLAWRDAIKSQQQLEALSPEETRLMLHELRVHQTELEMQNDELRRAQGDLEAAQARYFDLYDLAPVGFCTLSKEGGILQANLTAAMELGVARGTLIKQFLTRYILKEDQDTYYLLRKQLLESGAPQSCELRMLKGDGTHFWAHITATAGHEFDNTPAFRVVILDITHRKLVELQNEHERGLLEFLVVGHPLREALDHILLSYEALFPGMRGSVLLLDAQGKHLSIAASPSMPPSYYQPQEGVEIIPASGPCGEVAFTGKAAIAEDIAHDSRWVEFKDRALAHGLRACWSVPIRGASDRLLGTFSFYFDTPRAPHPTEWVAMERGAHLASLAIERR